MYIHVFIPFLGVLLHKIEVAGKVSSPDAFRRRTASSSAEILLEIISKDFLCRINKRDDVKAMTYGTMKGEK